MSVSAALHRGTLASPPIVLLSDHERVAAFALDGVGFGMLAGVGATLVFGFIASVEIFHAPFLAIHGFATCLTLALVGILCGSCTMLAQHLKALDGLIAVSLTFLPAVLLPLAEVPLVCRAVAYVNPAFYFVDGFRYGITGDAQSSLVAGLIMACILNLLLAALCCRALAAARVPTLR